jgi:hypothetical protein
MNCLTVAGKALVLGLRSAQKVATLTGKFVTNRATGRPIRTRGTDQQQSYVFSCISLEQRVRKGLSAVADPHDSGPILNQLSIQREQLLQMLYPVRSELLMEELDYNILLRSLVGLNLDDSVWDASSRTVTGFWKSR